eukprot:GHVQ01002407.1.p1 GENE.GHVQ01002407.1~~GHVQ01002407.1.p1  ORF type:complete len:542 (+),score=66.91 GHVQ01002407.1:476-2101(+)
MEGLLHRTHDADKLSTELMHKNPEMTVPKFLRKMSDTRPTAYEACFSPLHQFLEGTDGPCTAVGRLTLSVEQDEQTDEDEGYANDTTHIKIEADMGLSRWIMESSDDKSVAGSGERVHTPHTRKKPKWVTEDLRELLHLLEKEPGVNSGEKTEHMNSGKFYRNLEEDLTEENLSNMVVRLKQKAFSSVESEISNRSPKTSRRCQEMMDLFLSLSYRLGNRLCCERSKRLEGRKRTSFEDYRRKIQEDRNRVISAEERARQLQFCLDMAEEEIRASESKILDLKQQNDLIVSDNNQLNLMITEIKSNVEQQKQKIQDQENIIAKHRRELEKKGDELAAAEEEINEQREMIQSTLDWKQQEAPSLTPPSTRRVPPLRLPVTSNNACTSIPTGITDGKNSSSQLFTDSPIQTVREILIPKTYGGLEHHEVDNIDVAESLAIELTDACMRRAASVVDCSKLHGQAEAVRRVTRSPRTLPDMLLSARYPFPEVPHEASSVLVTSDKATQAETDISSQADEARKPMGSFCCQGKPERASLHGSALTG